MKDKAPLVVHSKINVAPQSSVVVASEVNSQTAQQPASGNNSSTGWSPPPRAADYDRSRSETPTRDENLETIGEIIIKQPPPSLTITRTINSEVSTVTSQNNSPSGSRRSSVDTQRSTSRLLHRVHSPSPSENSDHGKHSQISGKSSRKNSADGGSRRRHLSRSDSENEARNKKQKLDSTATSSGGKKPDLSRRSSVHGGRGDMKKAAYPAKLIKREYSPSTEYNKKRGDYRGGGGNDVQSKRRHQLGRTDSQSSGITSLLR